MASFSGCAAPTRDAHLGIHVGLKRSELNIVTIKEMTDGTGAFDASFPRMNRTRLRRRSPHRPANCRDSQINPFSDLL